MARRRRTGAAEDIIDLTAQLPLWAGVALASIRQRLLPLLCLIGAAADGEKFRVQHKNWKAYKVGVSVVCELFGLVAAKGAAGGFVITSCRNIRLLDGEALFGLIQSLRKAWPESAAALQRVPLPAVWRMSRVMHGQIHV